jgi:gluconokinase
MVAAMQPRFFIVMGVSGCGKSTVGKLLAQRLGQDFYDADDFHSPANIAKMASGIPLNDDDRASWLDSLHDLIENCLKENRPGVLACSALKESYRQTLLAGNHGIQIIYLKGSYDQIFSRLSSREAHFMSPELLLSQFNTLEEPAEAITVDVSLSTQAIVDVIIAALSSP